MMMMPNATEEENLGLVDAHSEFVAVAFAADRTAADRWIQLLEKRGIPAMLDEDVSGEVSLVGLGRGIPVLVPAPMHDAATEVVALDDDEDEDDIFDGDDEDEDFEDDEFDDLDDLDDDFEDDEDDDFEDDDLD
jgi:hypothetical protein